MKKQPPVQDIVASKPTLDIQMTPANNANDFIKLGRDVHSHVMGFLGLRGAIRLSRSCTSLWVKNQGALFRLFLQETQSNLNNDAFAYLVEAIELDENFDKFTLNFAHLSRILSSILPVLGYLIKNDLRVAPKFAAICGKKNVVEELLGDKITGGIDVSNHCITSYYAAGGQIECLEDFRIKHPTVFLYYIDPTAQSAALGGQIDTLRYLKNLNYDLNKVFVNPNGIGDETLLTSAVKGGQSEMVDFLIGEGVSSTNGPQLALTAAQFGHWKLYDRLKEEDDPLSGYLDEKEVHDHALFIACNALRTGNLELGLTLMRQYSLDPKKLFIHVIEGGNAEVFWHFINNTLVSLTDKFENDATVEHLIAQYGHVSLLKEVINDPRPKNGVHAVDANGKSTLHYAAKGGQYKMFSFLLRFFDNAAQKDSEGNTPAHTAAEFGSVWFLKPLMKTKLGRVLMKGKCSKNNAGETVLHRAAEFGNSDLLFMLIDDKECGIDLYSVDNEGFMVIHKLAGLAITNSDIWDTLNQLMLKYGSQLMDTGVVNFPNNTVRGVMEACGAQKYFDKSVLAAKKIELK